MQLHSICLPMRNNFNGYTNKFMSKVPEYKEIHLQYKWQQFHYICTRYLMNTDVSQLGPYVLLFRTSQEDTNVGQVLLKP